MKRKMAQGCIMLISGNDTGTLAVLRDGTHVQACSDNLKLGELGGSKPAVSITDLVSNINIFFLSGASEKKKIKTNRVGAFHQS